MAKKKTKRNKILIPRIKELQTTPDLSLINPILEDNTIICLHGGRVQLKAKNAKRIKSENIPLMLNNEIQGASIIGCPNPPILGGPCTKVTLVFPYTLTQHKINNKRAVLQMGLIGVSNKGYPIFAIPKKNKIQFSPLKLPSNPLPKIEYQRNQWEGMGEIQKSNKANKKAEIGNNISSVVQDEIPPNVIRIETQDDSGKFIEIELPEENQEESQGDKGLMVLEVIRKWEYSPNNEEFKYWATISEFSLKLDDEIVKDSEGKDIKGYIVEPAGYNPNVDKIANEQQKIAGSDTRIPAGEYEVFWRPSGKKVKKDSKFLGKLSIEFKSGFVPELRAINGTDMGKRSDILIHIGNTGEDTLGCLMPNKAYANNVASGSAEMTEKLVGAIIRHDSSSYINAIKTKTYIRTNENVVKNFIIKITEEIMKDEE